MTVRMHIRADLCVPELGIVPSYIARAHVPGRAIDAALTRLFHAEVSRRGFLVMTARGRRELIACERIAFT